MHGLSSIASYGIGATPMHRVCAFCQQGQLFLKFEQCNATGSIKARTAHFIVEDLIRRRMIEPGMTIVESTSGNLGVALALFGNEIGVSVVCLVDPTVPNSKVQRLREAGAEIRVVDLDDHVDYRSARMAKADRLSRQAGWVWPNQYENSAGMSAHEKTTGPEIWDALEGKVDCVVAAVGTGGTICGIARALKMRKPDVEIVAVEPLGSTIFGGTPSSYISAGAGLHEPSPLLHRHGRYIDRFAKVSDAIAIQTCHAIAHIENVSVGPTAGAAIAVAHRLAVAGPNRVVVAIVPDGSEGYDDILDGRLAIRDDSPVTLDVCDATGWHRSLSTQ